jgi:hypothetical protein
VQVLDTVFLYLAAVVVVAVNMFQAAQGDRF